MIRNQCSSLWSRAPTDDQARDYAGPSGEYGRSPGDRRSVRPGRTITPMAASTCRSGEVALTCRCRTVSTLPDPERSHPVSLGCRGLSSSGGVAIRETPGLGESGAQNWTS